MRQELQIPPHLNASSPAGLVPGETIAQYEFGPLRNFSYFVIDWTERTAFAIDPQKDTRPIEDLAAHGIRLVAVFLTHTHHDHVAGLPLLLASDAAKNLRIHLHTGDRHRLRGIDEARLRLLEDGETLSLSKRIVLKTLHTPGHSAGELCYVVEDGDRGYLLSGDTLFIRDCGRTDLDTGDTEEMFHTLQRLKALPDSLILLPGHHYTAEVASTLGREKRTSPPLLCTSVEELSQIP